jgi:hypothetical protein
MPSPYCAWHGLTNSAEQVVGVTQDTVWARVSIVPAGNPVDVLCAVRRSKAGVAGSFLFCKSSIAAQTPGRALHHWRVACIRTILKLTISLHPGRQFCVFFHATPYPSFTAACKLKTAIAPNCAI